MKSELFVCLILLFSTESLLAATSKAKNVSAPFFGSRKPLYECKNEKNNTLSFYDVVEKKNLPAGLSILRDGQVRNLELSNTKSSGKTVTSQIFRYDGFTKIVQEVAQKDSKSKQEKKEMTKVLIDELAEDAKEFKYVATLELFDGSDLSKALVSEKFDCQKTQ